MDAVKILGSLLQKNALGSTTGRGILESLLGGGGTAGRPGVDPGSILSTLLGGRKASGKGSFAALAALLAAALARHKGAGGPASEGGLGELLAGRSAGRPVDGLGGLGGALGDLVGGMLGGGKAGAPSGLGGLLGSLLETSGTTGLQAGAVPPPLDPGDSTAEAELLVEAMCLAAKADGSIDEEERRAILGQLGELDEEERVFLERHLASRVEVENFVRRVPADMAEQVYAFALMAVRLDSREEAEWFSKLARGLRLDESATEGIHRAFGRPGPSA